MEPNKQQPPEPQVYPNLAQAPKPNEQPPPYQAGSYQAGPYQAGPYQQVPLQYQTQPTTVTITQQPVQQVSHIVITSRGGGQALSPDPKQMTCPNCHNLVFTETVPTPGLLAFLMSGLCCFFGCVFGCCLIPCCIRECQDIEHRCPMCKQYLGKYDRMRL